MENGKKYPLILTIDEVRKIRSTIGYDSLKLAGNVNIVEAGDLVIVPDAPRLILRPRKFLSTILMIRRKYGFKSLIYAQGIADPYLLPSLVYAGVSVFDDLYPRMDALNGIAYGPLGKYATETDSTEQNLRFTGEIVGDLARAISDGTLREVVEKFVMSSKSSELLRILEKEYYAETEETFPARTPQIRANLVDSLSRPDLVRYRDYVTNRYMKPQSKTVALLIPCSARKPYSSSRSHRSLIERLGALRKFTHEIIITSPVGVVPRELEETYPPRFYDVPVTGNWYEDEKVMIGKMLSAYFSRNRYDHIIALVKEDLNFISDFLPNGSDLISGRIDRTEDLDKLVKKLDEFAPQRPVSHDERMERMSAIARYQFGDWIGNYIENFRIIRSYNQYMFTENGEPRLVYNEPKGSFSIHKSFAGAFIKEGKFVVSIEDFKPTSNVYAIGVVDATRDVRPEGEVVVSHSGEPRGTGIAKMPIEAMIQLEKGVAVKMR